MSVHGLDWLSRQLHLTQGVNSSPTHMVPLGRLGLRVLGLRTKIFVTPNYTYVSQPTCNRMNIAITPSTTVGMNECILKISLYIH